MAYDKEMDKQIWTKRVMVNNFTFDVSIMQYGEGAQKIQITRRTTDGDRWMKLGRLTKEEITALLPILKEAADKLEE